MTGIQRNFLISFMVDARGGAMRGCRHPGVRVIIPPRKCCMPTRVTCRLITKEKLTKPPPLLEGEGLAARIIEMGPVGTKFLGPVLLEVPHFASLRGKEREVVILRSDNGESWYEHPMQATEDAITEALGSSSEELDSEEDVTKKRIKRILTSDLPMYFALVSRVTRVKQESTVIGMEGGVLSSNVVPQVQAVLPEGTLTRPIPVGLQAQPIAPELVAKLLGNRVAVSPIVTIEPRRRKFHKPITLTIPVPRAAQKGMINQYGGERPTLRLLFSLAADPNPAVWEDVTETKPMTLVDDCVSFTTTVSARFWLIDCQNVAEAAQMASILYQEAVTVPYMARFVVFAKRDSSEEGKLRIFCMTDDKDDKTLEKQEKFFEVARSRDIEVLEGRPQFVEMAGNLIPVTKSGDQLHVNFKAFRENRLSCTVKVRDQDQDAAARVAFMKEPKVARGEAPQTPICNLNIRLPDMVLSESGELDADRAAEIRHRHDSLRAQELVIQDTINQAEMKLSDIADTVQGDWVVLAQQLQISISDINHIKNDYKTVGDQALAMLHFWVQKSGDKATGTQLENALRRINRDDVVRKCLHHVVRADDAVEAAAARVAMDQSGFDTFKEEVGITKDSLKRGMSLDVQYDEQDMIKESESAAEDSPTAVKDHLRDELQYRAPRATDEAPPADWISTDFVEATVYDRRPCAPAPKLPGAEDEESRLRKEAYVDFALQLDQLAEIQDSRLSREDSDEQSEPSVGEEEIVKSTKTSAEEAFPSLKAGISSEPQEQPPQLKRVPDRPRVTFSDQLDRVQQEDTYEEYDRGEEILTPPPSPTDKLEAEENSDEDEDAQEMTEIVETYRISEDGNVWKTIQKTTVITTNGSTERIVVLKEEPVLATETNIAEAATRLASSADVQGDSEDKYGHPKTEREVMYSRAEIVPREVTSSYEGVQQVVSESSGQVLSPVSDGGSSYHDEPSPVPEPTLPEDFRIDELAYERPEDEDDDDVVHKEEFYSERHEDLLPQKDVYRAADYSRSSDVKTYPVHIVSANYEDLQEQVLVVDSTSQAEADDSQWKVADTFIKVSHVDEDFPGAQDYPESEYTDENAVIAQSELDDSQVASAASSVLAPAAFVGEQETGRSSVEDLDSRSKVVGAFTSSEQINKEVEEEIKAVKSEDLSTQGDLPAHMEVVSEGNPEKEETEVEEHEEILPDGTVHRIRKVRSQTVKKIKRTMKSLDGEEEVVEEKEFIPGTIREDLVETFNEPPRMVRETEDMEQVLDDGTRVQRKIVYNRMIHRLRTHQESFDSDHGFQTEDFEIDEVIPGTESAFVAGNDTPDFSDSDDGSSPHEPEYSDENNPFDSEDFGENNPHDIQDVEQDTEATESKTTDPWEQDFAASDAVERRYQSGSFEEAEKLYLEDTTPRSYSPTLVEGQSLFPDTKSFQAEEKSQAGTEEQSLEAATASSLEYEHQQNLGTDASRRETDEQAAMNQDREDGQSYPQEWRELGDSGFAKRQVTKVTYYPDDPDTSDKLQAKDRVVVEEQEMRLEDSDFVREQLTLSQHELVEETELYKELHIADIHYELSEQVTVEEAQMLEILETREAAVVKEEQETYEIPEQQTVIVAEEMGITLVDEAVEVVSVQAAEEETVQEHIIASFTTRIDEVIEDHTEKDEFVTELADEADDVVHKEEFTEVVTKQKIEAVETEAPRHILVVESVSHPPLEETVEVVEQEDEESEQSMEKSLTDDVLEEQASKDEPESPITDLKYTSLADPATTELVREKIETIEEVVSRMERKFELTSSDAFEKTYTSSSYEKFVSDKLVHDEERVSYEHEKFVVHEEGEIGHDQDRGKEEFRSELTEDASETMQDFSEIKSELVESLESHHELDTSKEHITEPSEAEEVSKLTETKAQATDLEDQTVEDRDLGTQRDLDDMQDTLEESEQQQHTFGHLQKEERYFAVESTVTDAVEKILDEVPVDDQVTLVSNVFEKEEPEIRTAVEASEVVERQDYEPAESKLETVSYSYQDQTVSETFMDAAALDEQRFHGKAVTDELLVEPHCFTAHIISTEIEGEEDEEIDQLVSEDMVTDLQKAEADMFVDERTIQPEAALDYDEGGEEEDLREEAITESRRSASDEKTEEEISYEGKFTEGIDEELESVAATAGSDVAGAEEVDQEYLSETKDSSEPEAVDEGQTLRPSFVEQDKVMLEEDVDMDDDERKYQTEREESIEKGAQETVEIKHKAFEEEGREEEETDKACDFERELEIEHRQMGETDETQDREIEDEFEDKEIEDKYEDREIRDKDEYKEIEDKYEDSKIEDKDEHKEIEDKYEDRVIEDKYEDRVIEDKYEDRVIKDKDEDKEIEDKYEDSEIEDREVGGKDEDRNIKDKYDLEEDLLDRKHTDEISDEKEIYEEKEQTCIHEGTIPEIVEDLVTSIESSDVEAQVSSLPDEEEDEIKETIEVTKVKITHTQPDDYSEEEKEKEKSKSIEEDVAAAKDSTDMVQSAHHEDLEPLTSIEHEFSRVAGQEIAELQEDSIDAGRDISDITQSHRSFATLPDEEVEEIQEISKEEVFPSKIKETRTQLDERDALDGVVDDSSSAEKPDEDAGVEQAEDEYVSVGVKPSEHEDINLGSSYSREFEEHYTSRIVETTSSYEHRKEERHTEICMTSEFLQNSEQTVHEHEEFGETYEKETVEVTQRDEDDEYDVLGAEKGIDDKYDDWVLLNREELTENEIAQAATLVMVGRPLADDEEEEEQKDYEEERDYDIRIGEQSRDMKAYFDTDIEAPIRDKRLGEDLLDKDLIEQTVSPVEVASVSHEVDSDVVGLTKDELESSTGEVEMQRYSPTQEVESHDLQYTTNLMDVEETKEKKAMKETKSKIHHRMFIETQVESVEIEGMDASASIEQSDQDESTEIEEYAEVEKKTPPFYVADATMKVTSEEKEVSEKFESPVADMSSQQYEKGFISETTTSRVDYNMTMMTTHFASEHAEEFYVSEQDASEALLEAQSREDHKDYPKAVISDQYDISPSISLTAEECIEKAGEAERAEKSLPLPDESSESVSVSEKAIGSSPEEQENLDDDNVLDQDEEFVKDVDEGFVKDVDEEFDKDVDEFGKDVGEEFDKDVDEEFDKDVDEEFDKDVDEEFDKDVNEGFVKDIDEELDQEIEEQEQLTAALLSQYSKESDEEYEDEEEEEVDFDEEKSSETYMDRGDAGLEPLEETRPENQLELIPEQSPDSDLAKYVTDTTDVEEAHVSQDMGAETVEVEIPTKVVDFEDKEFKEEEVGMAFEKYETEPEIVVPIGAVIGENAEIEVCDIDKAFEKYETEPEIVVPIDAVMGEHAEIEVCDIDKAFEKYETEPEIVVPIDAVIGEHAEIEVCDIDKAFEKYETEPEIVVPIDAVIGEHAEIEVCDIDKAFEKYETEPEIVVPIDAVIGEHAEIEVSDIDKAFEKYETEPEIVVPIDAVIGEHAEIEVCDINQVFEKYEHEAEVPVPIGARVEHSHIEQEYEERGEFEANLEEPERSTVTEYEDRTSFQDKVSIAVIIDEVMGEPEEDSEVDQERFEKHEDESEADHDRFEKHEDEIEVDHDRFEKHDDESEADHDRFEIHEYETEVDHDRFEIHEYQTEVDHDRFEKHEDESKVDHDRFEKHEDESEADHDRFEKHEDESEADHDRFEKHEDESEADHDRFEKHEDESEADHDRFEKHEDESEVDHDRFEKHESEVDHDRFEKHESEVDHERFENYEDESEEDHETLEKHEEPHMLPSFETEVLLIKDGERFSEDDLTQERHEAQVDSAEVQHTEMGHGDGAHDEDQLDIMYQVTEMTKEEVAEEAGDEEDFISDSYIDKPRDEVVIEEREILQMLQHEVTDRTVSAEVTHLTDQEEMKAMEMEYEVELSKAIVQEALHTSIETTRRTDEERETGDQPQSSSGIMAEMQMLEDQQAEEELISEDDLDDDKYGEEAEEETYDQMIEMVPHEDDALRAEIDLGHKEHASTLEVTEIGDDQTEVYSELEQSIDRTEMKLEKVDISITEEATHALDRKESKLEETADQLDGERLEGSTEEVEFFIDQVQTVHQEAAIDICSLSAVQAREATESSLLQEENETEDNEFNKKYFIQAQEIDTKLEAPYTDSDTQEIDTDQAETFIDRSERFLETLQDVIIPEQDEKDRLATPYTSLGAAGEPHEESPSHTGSEASPTSQQATGDYDGSQATIDGMNMGLHLPRSPFYPTSSTEVHDRSGSPSDLEDEITEVEVKLSERKQIESFEEESQEEEFQEAFSQPQEETTLTRSGQEKPEMPGHTFMASSISGSDYTSPSDAEYAQSETTGTGSFYTAPSERMSSSSCTAQSETMTGSEYTMTASDYDHEADEEEYESEGRLSADISQQIFIEHKFSRRHGDQDVSSSDEEYEEGVDHLDRPPSPSEFTLIASQDTERLSISLGLTTQGGSRVLPQHTISPLAMENVQPHQDSVHFDTDIEKDSLQDEEEVHEDYDEDEDEDEEAEPEEDDGGRMSVDFATSERPPSPSDFTLIASQDQESLQRILNAEETLSPEQETGSPMQWEQDLEKAIIDADAMSTASSDQALMIGLDRISVTGTDNNTMSGVSSESGHQVDGESPLEDDVEDRQHLYQAYMREMESERLALAEEELREKVWSLSRSEEFSAETFEDVPRGGRDDDIVYDMYEDHVQSQMSLQEKEDSKDTLNLEVGYISPQAHFDDISQEEIQGQVTKFEEGVLVPAEEAGVSGKVDDDSTETKEQTHVEYGHTKVEVTERALVSGTSEIEDERDTESSWFSEEKQDMISTHVKYSYTYEEKQEIRSSEEAFKHTSLREEVESSSEYKVSSLTSHSESKSCLEFQLEPGHHLAQHDQQAEKRFDEQGQEMAAMALQASDKMSSSSSEVAQLDDFDNQDVEIREVSEETSEETDVEDQFSPVLTETAEPAFSFEVSSIGLSDEKVKRVQSSNLSPVAVKGQQEMVLKSYTEKKHAVTSQEVTETVHGEVDSVCGVALDAATENVEQEAQDVEVSSDYEAVKKHFEPVEVIDVDSGANLHEQVELTEEHEIDEEVEDIDDTELEPELCGLSHSDDHEVDGDEEEDEVEEEEIIEHEIESEESGEFIEGEDEFREDEQEEGIIEMEVCTAYENMAFRDEEVPEWTEETFPVKSELVRQETRDISPEDLEEKPFTYDFPDDFMQEMTFQDHYERTYTESVNIAADREVLQSFTVAQKIVSHADIQESWEDAVEEEVEEEAATDDRWEPSDDIGGQHMSKHVADMTSVDAADEPEAAGGNEIQVEEEEDSEVSSKSSSDSGGVEVFDEQTGQYTRLPWEIAHQYKRQFSESFAEEQKSAVKPQKSIDMGTFYRRDKSKDEEFLEKSFYSESDPLDSDSVAKRKVTFELEQEDVLGTTEPECEPEYFVAEHARPHPCEPYEQIDDTHDVDVLVTILESRQHVRSEIAKQVYDQEFPETPKQDTEFDMVARIRTVHSEFDMPSEFDMVVRTRSIPSEFDESEEDAMLLYQRSSEERHYISEHRSEMISVVSKESRMAQQELLLQESLDEEDRSLSPSRESCSKKLSTTFEEILPQTTPAHPTDFPMAVHSIGKSLADNEIYESSETERDSTEDKLSPIEETPGIDEIEEDDTTLKSTPPVEKKVTFQTDHLTPRVSEQSTDDFKASSSSSELSVEPTLLAASYDLDSGNVCHVVTAYDISPDTVEKQGPIEIAGKSILSSPEDDVFETDALSPHKATALSPEGPLIPRGHLLSGIDVCPSPPILIAPVSTPREGSEKEDLSSSLQTASTILEMLTHGERMDSKDGEDTTLQDDDMSSPQEEAATNDLKSDEGSLELEFPVDVRFAEATVFSEAKENGFGIHYEETEVFEEEYVNGVVEVDLMHDDHRRHVLNGPTEVDYIPEYDQGDDETLPVIMDRPEDVGQPVPLIYESNLIEVDTASFLETRLDVQQPEEEQAGVHDGTEEPEQPTVVTSSQAKPDVQQPTKDDEDDHEQPDGEKRIQPSFVSCIQAKPDIQQPTKDDDDDNDGDRPDGEKRIQPSFVSCVQAKPDIQQPTKDDDDDNDGDRPDGEKRIQPSFVSCVQAKPDIQQPTKDDDDDNDGDRPDGEKRIQPSFVSCVQAKPDIQQPTKDDDDDNDGDRPDGEKRIQPSFVSCVQAKPDIQQPTKDDDDDNDGDQPDGEKRLQPFYVSYVHAKPDIRHPEDSGSPLEVEGLVQPVASATVQAKPDIQQSQGDEPDGEDLIQPTIMITSQAKPDIRQPEDDKDNGYPVVEAPIQPTVTTGGQLRQEEQPITSRHSMTGSESGLSLTEVEQEGIQSSYAADDEEFTRHTEHEISITRFSPERDEEEDLDQRMYLFSKETVYHGKRALESIADTTFSEVYEEREEALVEGYAMSGEPMLQDEPALQEGDDELELEEEEEFEERPEEELIRLEEPTAESDEEEEEEEESADMREEEEAREHSYSVISTGLSSTELLCISSGSQSDLDRPLSPTPDALRQGFWGGNFTPPQSGMYTPPITGAFTPPQTSQEQSGDDSTVLEKTAVTFVDSVLEDVKVKVSSQATTPEEITEEEFRKGYESEVNITIDKSPDQQTTSPEQAVAGDDYEYAQPDMSSEIVRKRGVTLVKQISEDIPGIILTQHLHEEVNEDEYYGYSPQPESIPEDEEDRYLKEIAKMVQEEDDEFSEVTVVVAQKDEVMQQACSFEDVKLETSESPPAVEFLTEDILPLTPSAPEMERESASYTEEHHFLVKSDPGSSFAFSEPVHTSSEHEGQLYVNSELESGSFDELEMLEPVLSPEDHADSSSLDSFATVVAAEADEDEEYEPDENRLAEIASMTSSFTSDIQVSFPDEYRKESAEDFGDTEDDDLSLERSQEWLSTTPDDKDRESDASNDSDKFEFVDRAALSVITEMSDEDKFEMIEREDLESEAGLSDHFGSSPDTNVQQSPGITNLRFFGRGAERDDASISSSLAEFEKLEKAIPISSSLSSIERGDGDRDSFGGSYDERKFVGFRKLKEGEEATSIASSLAEFEQLEQALVVSGSASSVEKHTPESKSSGGSGENTSNSVASSLADFERFEQECQGDSDEKKSSVESSSRPSEASSCTSLNEFERLEREIAVAAELEVEAQKIVSILESGVLMECAKFGSADFSEAAGEDEREEKDSVEDDGREEMDHDSLSEEARLGHEEDADSLDGESSEVTEMASSVVFAGPDLALSQAVPADFDTDSLQGEALMQLSSDSLVLEQRLKSSDSTRFDTDSLFDKDDRMVQSGDSLELGGQSSGGHSSEKQEDIIIAGDDIMQTSADSLEFDNSKEEAKDSEGKDQQQQDDSVMMVSVESAAWSMGSSGGTGHSLSESHTDSSHSHDIMQVSTDSDIVKSGARPEKISLLSEQLFASELAAAKEIHHFEQSHQWHQAETSVHHVTSSSSQQHQSVSESKTKPKRESPKFAEYEEPEKEGLHTPKYRDFFTEAQWEVMKQAEREKQETETKSSALSSSSPELSQESDRDEKQSPPSQPHLDMQPSQQTSMTYISTSTTTTSYYRGADYQGFGDEDVQTHRVVMKKEVHKRTMLGEDGQEETLVREESHIQQDDEPPEELQESMQEIIRQFMESEPEPRPVPEHQSLEDDV